MIAFLVGLMTLDILYRFDHVSDPFLKVTLTEFTMAADGPAMNAAVAYAALCVASCVVSNPEDEVGTISGAPVNSEETSILLTALGGGPVSAFLAADLAAMGVRVVDVTVPASSLTSREPAVSLIIEHPSGRMVTSTNVRLDADAKRAVTDLPERVGAAFAGGYNPAFVYTALILGIPEADGEDLFASFEVRPPHSCIPDSGSWREWLTPLLGFINTVAVSEDSAPPLMVCPDETQVAKFLRGFSATRTVCTRGDRTTQYWWDGMSDEIPVEVVPDASALGAGDAFHGVFVWAIERGGDADLECLIRLTSPVTAVSASSSGARQRLTSRVLAELVCGWQMAVDGARVARRDPAAAGPRQSLPSAAPTTVFS